MMLLRPGENFVQPLQFFFKFRNSAYRSFVILSETLSAAEIFMIVKFNFGGKNILQNFFGFFCGKIPFYKG